MLNIQQYLGWLPPKITLSAKQVPLSFYATAVENKKLSVSSKMQHLEIESIYIQEHSLSEK